MGADQFSGDSNGPSCPCEVAQKWVPTCDAHPSPPDFEFGLCDCSCGCRVEIGSGADIGYGDVCAMCREACGCGE